MNDNALLKKHFFNPLNMLSSKDNPSDFTSVSVGSKVLGDAVTLYVECDKKTKNIKQFKYKVYGNPYLIAALSYISTELIDTILRHEPYTLAQKLIDVFSIPKTKYYCAYMLEDACNQVMTKWQNSHD